MKMRGNTFDFGLCRALLGLYLLHQWGMRWGATDREVHEPLPGDAIVPHPMLETTHGITINASASEVWPWLVQMGYYRGGWYTERNWNNWWWEWADEFVDHYLQWLTRDAAHASGDLRPTIPSAERIMPELQTLALGDVILDGPPGTAFFTVAALEPARLLALYSTTHLLFALPAGLRDNDKVGIAGEFSWSFILRETGESRTRLILRTRANVEPRWYRAFVNVILPAGELFIARKLLGGIRQRAEARMPTVSFDIETGTHGVDMCESIVE